MVQVIDALEGKEGDRGVSWLPFFHDMGLITALLSPVLGHNFTFMTPARVRAPARPVDPGAGAQARGRTGLRGLLRRAELRLRTRRAARRAQRRRAALDLSNVKGDPQRQRAGVGGVDAQVQRGVRALWSAGDGDQAVLRPGRGHAVRLGPPRWTRRRGLSTSTATSSTRALRRGPATRRTLSRRCPPAIGVDEWAVIVDAERPAELPDGHVGEIWLHGQNMGIGYWGRDEETEATFRNFLKSRSSQSRAEGAATTGLWVRTGDYGIYHDGHLYITGRVKDLVIVDGRNHYPQDLEYSAQEASRALRTGYVAAFSYACPAQFDGSAVVGVECDLHRNPLHHLGEIAGGVVRRQQREFLAAGGRDAVDPAVHDLAREHVDGDSTAWPLRTSVSCVSLKFATT